MAENVRTEPVWKQLAKVGGVEAPSRNRFDVCIVGAGIAGISTAYRLVQAGQRVIVIDDGAVGGGQTGCTTAHLASAIDDRFTELERIGGEETSRLAGQSHAAAIDAIEEIVQREGIPCEFTRLDGYLIPHEPGEQEFLERELAAARRAGLTAEMITRAPLNGCDTGPAIRFRNQGQFHPLAYLEGLARAILDEGSLIRTGVHVNRVDDGAPAHVETDAGWAIDADAVVVATNSPINDRLAMHTKQFPYTTYAIALDVPANRVAQALYWDTLDPYHYVRLMHAAKREGDDKLIVGGEDHRTGQATDQPRRFQRLEEWARSHFPDAGALTHRWSGQVLETLDGLAFIGLNPGEKHVYIVTGDSGMGMTHGTIASMLLTDLIRGRENPWKGIYDPARKPVKGLLEFASENLKAATTYASWLTPGEVASVDEIKPGSGAVVRLGLRKLAVYRDDKGFLHVRSAVCPHLNSLVTWNAAEKTWDCPAHGSRFTCDGQVTQGPANSNLEPVDLDTLAPQKTPASTR